MRSTVGVLALLGIVLGCSTGSSEAEPTLTTKAAEKGPGPIRLHPANPRYFLFRGKPTILVTAGNYGAVVNLDIDYVRYLDELRRNGFNQTRLWPGTYVSRTSIWPGYEDHMAPAPHRVIVPWARSSTPGYVNGGNKFDLSRWDERYFARLKDFVRQASRRGIVVEVTLFTSHPGGEWHWQASPFYGPNNVNGVGHVPSYDIYRLDRDRGLLAAQEAFVRKIVTELNDFDNVYWELLNEPYWARCQDGVGCPYPADWQDHIKGLIWSTEGRLGRRHMIAEGVADKSGRIESVDQRVSVYNFHYARPLAVLENADVPRAIADDETGHKGADERPYRSEAWNFLLAGGAVFSKLDWSFTASHEDGTYRVPSNYPYGSGGQSLRRQLSVLKRFVERLPFLRMRALSGVIAGGVPHGARARTFGAHGRAYAIYLEGGTAATLTLRLRPGRYRARWVDTLTGRTLGATRFRQGRQPSRLASPRYREDIALAIERR
jgi:hypothetical protein